ncbi:DUF397 domain-containing protein [Streptomyces sp. NPDC048172]|uniref:DUF397 domain-containing protein n=1 Tax=Streptomyces sp. NPDC048172 TaxID=3365505 RepID=UPI00371D9037
MEPLAWQKSSFSGNEDAPNCVEVADDAAGGLLLRESEAPGVTLAVSPAGFDGLVRHLKGD